MTSYYNVVSDKGKVVYLCQDHETAKDCADFLTRESGIEFSAKAADQDYLLYDDNRQNVSEDDLRTIEVEGLTLKFYIADLTSILFQLRRGIVVAESSGANIVELDSDLALLKIRYPQAKQVLEYLTSPSAPYLEEEKAWHRNNDGEFQFARYWGNIFGLQGI